MKTLLRSLLILVGLVAVLLLAVVVLVFTLDLNRLKPLLERQAAERGIELQIPGDISWKLFPNLALSLGALNIHSMEDKTLLAAVNQADVSVQLLPIFKRQILVDGIRLDGLEVHYAVDEQGKSAWETIGGDGSKPAEPQAEPDDAGAPTELAVERVDITKLKLFYTNAQTGDRAEIQNLNLQARNVALEGQAFPLKLELDAKYNDMPNTHVVWDGPVAVNLDAQTLKVTDANLNIQVGAAKLVAALATDTFWGEPLTSKGQIKLDPTALPPLLRALEIEPPQTANPKALQQVGATVTYNFGPDSLTLEPVSLTVDGTRIDGQLQVKNFDKPAIVTGWQGGSLVLDDYLPPESETEETAAAPETPPQPLPLETLRDLNLNAKVGFEKLTYKGLPINQPQLQVTANGGLIKLDTLSLQTADGKVTGEGQLDARGAEAQLRMDVQSQGVDLGTLLKTFADLDKVTGKASATAHITSRGATDKALLEDNLIVEATAQSEELRVVPINIEEQFCRAISILQQQSLPENLEWPDMTRLEPVKMQLRYAEKTLNLQQLNATIANLISTASGFFKVDTGEFNVPFSLSLGEFANKVEGCLPIDEKWRKRALPIRCKGSLENIGPTTCLPDTQLLTDLVKDRVKSEAKEKIEEEKDRLEDKLGTKAKDLLQEKLGEEKSKSTEQSVRNLLDQFKKKKEPEPAKQ
ncbi:AsmA family protein [Saccharophagus sp. K07]|uniref:AsmA family protein n=1 Tax=Saccharophagus sp. K07 TaxID=2283636 RepID=UPI001651DDDD|nr:AsmA family protein [Saccharophagus sp. K07]MBC6906350.1 AsmA family protein [Saccharophagus sp. K07]